MMSAKVGCRNDSDMLRRSGFGFVFLLPLFACVLIVALFADFLPPLLGNYSGQRFFLVVQLIVVGGAALIFSCFAPNASGLFKNWPLFVLSFSFFVLSLPVSAGPYRWVEPGLYVFFFLVVALLGWAIWLRRYFVHASLLWVIVSSVACFLYGAMSLTVYAFAITGDFSNLIDVIPWGFVNMRYWSHLATWLLPLLPLSLLCGPLRFNRLWRLSVFAAAGLWWWILFLTTSRGSMVSLAVAFVAVLIIFGRLALPWFLISMRFLLLGVAIWCVLSWGLPGLIFDEVLVRGLHAGSSGRVPLWLEAFAMSLENFPFGMGAQSWLTHTILSDEYRVAARFGHPHNMYLMWAAEYGWLLIAVLLVFIAVTLRRLVVLTERWRCCRPDDLVLLAGFVGAAMAGFAHAGVSAVFMVPATMCVGFAVLAILWAFVLDAPHKNRAFGLVGRQLILQKWGMATAAFVLVLVGALWFRQVFHYHEAMEQDLVEYGQSNSALILPRFWLHGNYPRPE